MCHNMNVVVNRRCYYFIIGKIDIKYFQEITTSD